MEPRVMELGDRAGGLGVMEAAMMGLRDAVMGWEAVGPRDRAMGL